MILIRDIVTVRMTDNFIIFQTQNMNVCGIVSVRSKNQDFQTRIHVPSRVPNISEGVHREIT